MGRWKTQTIQFQLWSGMMILVLVVLLLLWLFQVVFLQTFYTKLHIDNITEKAQAVVVLWEKGEEEAFFQELDSLAYENNLGVEFFDHSRASVYATTANGSNGQIPMANNENRHKAIDQVISGESVNTTTLHPRYGSEITLLGLPVFKGGQVAGALMVSIVLAPVKDTAAILKTQLIAISVILMVVALLLSYLISRRFTKPIVEIKKASEAMASGDFSVRLALQKQDEIGTLAGTINHLGEQLSKIEQLRKDLIANVSHELRTPLSLIQGYAETLRDVTGHLAEKRETQLGIIIEEAQRLSRLVDDILKLSQLQSGNVVLTKSVFPLEEILQGMVNRFDLVSEKSLISFQVISPDHVMVEGDQDRLEQVLVNLVQNAFHHSPPGGIIRLCASPNSAMGSILLQVTDTGKGISQTDLPFIWDRYYKGDRAQSYAGTGLGLSIVKSILQAHQVPFGVESKEGAGTTFWFELPTPSVQEVNQML